jgi:uncharacterized protein
MPELPLFPLNTVLFPGMVINLHIFEERYKQMIDLCMTSQQPFGVVLIEEGQEAFGPAKPHLIGCTAQLARIQPLEQGRMDISAVGRERFEIQSLQYDRPYLVGSVEMRPIRRNHARAVMRVAARLRPLVLRYLDMLADIENVRFDLTELPADPVAFAYLAAAILQQVPLTRKQDLLASNRALDLLVQIRGLYQFEVALLEMMIERAQNSDNDILDTFFSAN